MIYIKRFIDKVSMMENKQNKDIILPIMEARGLRDEIAKLMAEVTFKEKDKPDPFFQVEVKGGSFK